MLEFYFIYFQGDHAGNNLFPLKVGKVLKAFRPEQIAQCAHSPFPFFPFPTIFVLILQIREDIRMSVRIQSMNKSKSQIVSANMPIFTYNEKHDSRYRNLKKGITQVEYTKFLGSCGSFIYLFSILFISYLPGP